MQKIKELLKHRGILSVLVAVIAGLAGYNVETVTEWELPVIKVEVTNFPPTIDVPPPEPTEPNRAWPGINTPDEDLYELNPPKVTPGIEVPVEEALREHNLRLENN